MFIAFEGLDGSGKTTAVQEIKRILMLRGHQCISVREPGGSLGGTFRSLILHNDLEPVAETLCFFADRFQHLRDVIVPALDRGTIVLCDRFTTSTYMYQVVGKGVDVELFTSLEARVDNILKPFKRREFVLDVDFETAQQRLSQRTDMNRLDVTGNLSFQNMREAMNKRSSLTPYSRSVPASGSVEDTVNWILSALPY